MVLLLLLLLLLLRMRKVKEPDTEIQRMHKSCDISERVRQ